MKIVSVETVSVKKRNGWIWLIAIWFFVCAAFSLASFIAVKTGAIPMTESQRLSFDNLGVFDHVASVLIAVANLLGAIFLLMLRKEAMFLFWGALSINVLLVVWHVETRGLAAVLGGGLVGIAYGLGLLGVVCFYTWKLTQRKVLT